MIESELHWKCASFSELSNSELYTVLQLRSEVFVVEQNCAYQDMDDKDFESYHLCGWQKDELIAYTRLLPPGTSYPGEASIGRVLTSSDHRRKELGKLLMHKSIEEILNLFGAVNIVIGAQYYLKKFYESFDFIQISEIYLEDNIPHITMRRSG